MIVSGSPQQFKGFDDPMLQHQHSLQQALKQIVPLTLDGGREVLFWCQSCQMPWYAYGRQEWQTHVHSAQFRELAHRLQVAVTIPSQLPHSMCPNCSYHLFGGIPRIEVYTHQRGYRLSWDRVKSPATFLCCLYAAPSGTETIQEALTCSTDIPLPSIPLEPMVHWLTELPEPDWSHLQPFSPESCEHLTRFREPAPALIWQGYSWNAFCPPLGGEIIAVLGVTFSRDSECSISLLFECWRQIATAMTASC